MADDRKDKPAVAINYGGKVYGKIEFTAAADGVIWLAPDGTRYLVTIDNAGAFVATAI